MFGLAAILITAAVILLAVIGAGLIDRAIDRYLARKWKHLETDAETGFRHGKPVQEKTCRTR
jgi:hypothetical protein